MPSTVREERKAKPVPLPSRPYPQPEKTKQGQNTHKLQFNNGWGKEVKLSALYDKDREPQQMHLTRENSTTCKGETQTVQGTGSGAPLIGQVPWNERGDRNLLHPQSRLWTRLTRTAHLVLEDTVELYHTCLASMAPNSHRGTRTTDHLGASCTQYQHPVGQRM